MKLQKNPIQSALRSLLSIPSADSFRRKGGKIVGRKMTGDATFPFRMPGGIVGDANRTHPFTIEGCMIDPVNPVLGYGLAVLADQASPNGVRNIETTDTGITAIYGVSVRPFPLSPSTATNYGSSAFGPGTPPAQGIIDILKAGYIIVKLNGVASVFKGSPVFVYVAASSGSHVLGGFEGAAGANLIALDATGTRIYFNGPADPNGIVELVFNP
jgi:hypothetical protein